MSVLPGLSLWLVLAANPYLDEARQLYEKLEYEQAESRARLALGVPTASPEERRQGYDLLARALVAQGRLKDAQAAYQQLLIEHPHAPEPANAAPKIRAAFTQAKQALYPPRYVQLRTAQSPPGLRAFELVDPWATVAAVVDVGPDGKAQPVRVESHRVRLAAPREPGHRVEARDAAGAALATQPLEPDPGVSGLPPLAGTEAGAGSARAAGTGVTAFAAPGAPAWLRYGLYGLAGATLGAGTYFGLKAKSAHDAAGRARFGADIERLDDQAQGRALAANVLFGTALLSAGAAVTVSLAW